MAKQKLGVRVSVSGDFTQLREQIRGLRLDLPQLKGVDSKTKDSFKNTFNEIQNKYKNLSETLKKPTDSMAIKKAFVELDDSVKNSLISLQAVRKELADAYSSDQNRDGLVSLKKLKAEREELEIYKEQILDFKKAQREAAEQGGFKGSVNEESRRKLLESAKAELGEINAREKAGLEISAEELVKKKELLNVIKNINEYNLSQTGLDSIQKFTGYRSAVQIDEKLRENKRKVGSLEKSGVISDQDLESGLSTTRELGEAYEKIRIEAKAAGVEMVSAASKTEVEQKKLQEELKKSEKFGTKLLKFFTGASLFNAVRRLFNYTVNFFRSMDESLTTISVVTGKTRVQIKGLTKEYINMAREAGTTAQEIAKVAVFFYRQGRSDSEVRSLTETVSKFATVAGIDAVDAANRLTAAVNGYQLAASQSMLVADKMTALSANAATSVDELSTAISKVASQAKQAGIGIDYLYGYLTTMQEVTREAPENIGTSLKTIIARFQEIKDIGKTMEDGETSVNRVSKALSTVGINLLDPVTGQLRELSDVLNELGPMWNSLSRNQQAYLATTIAGTRQQSRFIALMANYQRAMDLVEVSQNSAGETARQHERYLKGVEAAFKKVENAGQRLVTTFADSAVISGFLNGLSTMLDLLADIASFKPFAWLVMGTAGMALLAESASRVVGLLKNLNVVKGINNTITLIGNSIKAKERVLIATNTKAINTETVALLANKKARMVQSGTIAGTSATKGLGAAMKAGGSSLGLAGSLKAAGAALVPLGQVALILAAIALVAWGVWRAFNHWKVELKKAEEAAKKSWNAFKDMSDELKKLDKASKTYLELSGKIGRTADEQERLNSAVSELTQKYKDLVVGYDPEGNVILDKIKLEERLRETRKESAEAAMKAAKDQMRLAATKASASVGERGFKTFDSNYNKETEKKANNIFKTEMKKVGPQIIEAMSFIAAESISEGLTGNQQNRSVLANRIAAQSIDAMSDEIVSTGVAGNKKKREKVVEKYTSLFEEEMANLAKVGGLDRIDAISKEFEQKIKSGSTWGEIKTEYNTKLQNVFDDAKIDPSRFQTYIGGVMDTTFANAVNPQVLSEQLQIVIDNASEGVNKQGLKKFQNELNNMSQGLLTSLSNSGVLDNAEENANYLDELSENVAEYNNAFYNEGKFYEAQGNLEITLDLYKQLNEETDPGKREKLGQYIDRLNSGLNTPSELGFEGVGKALEDAAASGKALNDALKEIADSSGTISFSSLQGVLKELDSMSEAALAAGGSSEKFLMASTALAEGMEVTSEGIKLNEEALKSLQEVQMESMKITLLKAINEQEAVYAGMELEEAMVKAQINALDVAIQAAQSGVDAKKAANEAMGKIEVEAINNRLGMVADSLKKEIGLNQTALSRMANLRLKFQAGEYHSIADANKALTDLKVEMVNEFQYTSKDLVKDVTSLEDLQNLRSRLTTQLGSVQDNMKNIRNQITILEKGLKGIEQNKLSGLLGGGAKAAAAYLLKLKEIFNIQQELMKIEQALAKNRSLQGMYDTVESKKFMKLMAEELALTKRQYELNKRMRDMQLDGLSEYASMIKSSDVKSVFDFDSDGFMRVNFDKLGKLTDAQKKKVDEFTDGYEKLQKELSSTDDALFAHAEALKKAFDTYRKMQQEGENLILEAVKERERQAHEIRVKALDEEINMINKARDARRKAREEDDSAKELSKAQEALRKAMMDTSGKNNAEILRLQEELSNKQSEISENRFDRELDSRISTLENIKKAEEDMFQFGLDNMGYYWSEVQRIQQISSEDILDFLKAYNNEYITSSTLGQEIIVDTWKNTVDTMKTVLEEGVNFDSIRNELKKVLKEIEDLTNKSIQIKATASSISTSSSGTPKTTTSGTTTQTSPVKPVATVTSSSTSGSNSIMFNNAPMTPWVPLAKPSPLTPQTTIKPKTQQEIFAEFLKMRGFSKGGLVDFNGPAWVHGSKSNPEAFLSAYQTKQITSLAGALSSNDLSGGLGSSIQIGSITFKVDSMNSTEDGKKALDKFVEEANKLMLQKGVGTRLTTSK
jgi:TP901 family phage tail tape measure protein